MNGSPGLPPTKISDKQEEKASSSYGSIDSEGTKTEFVSEKYNIGTLGLKKVRMIV